MLVAFPEVPRGAVALDRTTGQRAAAEKPDASVPTQFEIQPVRERRQVGREDEARGLRLLFWHRCWRS